MKNTLTISLLIFSLLFISYSKETKQKTPKKKGVVSKIGDAATKGYGWQLGKEAAKETVKGIKKAANSETVSKLKEKTKSSTKKLKDKDSDGTK